MTPVADWSGVCYINWDQPPPLLFHEYNFYSSKIPADSGWRPHVSPWNCFFTLIKSSGSVEPVVTGRHQNQPRISPEFHHCPHATPPASRLIGCQPVRPTLLGVTLAQQPPGPSADWGKHKPGLWVHKMADQAKNIGKKRGTNAPLCGTARISAALPELSNDIPANGFPSPPRRTRAHGYEAEMIEAVWERRLSRDGNGAFGLVVPGGRKTGGAPARHSGS